MTEIVHKDLSYEIVGALFDVYNEIGPGHKEKHYQKAVARALCDRDLEIKEQVRTEFKYLDEIIGIYIVDFLIGNKVALEIKRKDRFSKYDFNQALAYLHAYELELAILATFSRNELVYRRVVNIKKNS